MTSFEDEISLMIPAYLRGELSSDDIEKVESLATQNPQIAADIEFQKNLKAGLKAGDRSFEPGEMGWARLSKAMEQPENVANDRVKTSRFWQCAAAVLAVAAIGQAGVLGSIALDKEGAPKYVTVSDDTAVSSTLKIGLHPEATVKKLTKTLISVQGDIVQGPSALGLFQLQFPSESACREAVKRLKAQTDLIDTITPCE